MRGLTQERQSPAQALNQLRHGLQGYGIGVCFVASNAKRKEKEVFGASNNESKVT